MKREKRECEFVKENGEKCRAPALDGDTLCYFHSEDPEKKKARKEASSRGGAHPYTSLELPEVKDINDIIMVNSRLIRAVALGELPPNKGNCLGYLLGLQIKAVEVRDITNRLIVLENNVRLKV